MEIKTVAIIVNAVGLVLDICGVVILFYERDEGLKQVSQKIKNVRLQYSSFSMPIIMSTGSFGNQKEERVKVEIENNIKHNIETMNRANAEIAEQMGAIIGELNETIVAVEDNNTTRHKKAQCWLVLLIGGFALQLVSTFLGLVSD